MLSSIIYRLSTTKMGRTNETKKRQTQAGTAEKHKKVQNYSENGQIKTDGEDERSTRGINHTKRKSETTNRQPER
jgi:hypothetical protein